MTTADRRPTAKAEPVERTAARWFARRRSGEMSEAEGRELHAWLEADPAHRFAYDTIARAWARAGLMRTVPEVLQLRAKHRRPFPLTRRLLGSRAIAASLAAVALGLGATAGVQVGMAEMKRLPTATYSTKLGEQRTITLRAGT
ncbi:MAG TPA: DUF4880 domain-containing protein, partial [Caulobacteraceae bacterium]|nr:DUF4880 domain-containing protein [Caulobacteraceae bacterium]